jgi:hypothetical protein
MTAIFSLLITIPREVEKELNSALQTKDIDVIKKA